MKIFIKFFFDYFQDIVREKLSKTHKWKYPIDIVEITSQQFQMINMSNDMRTGLIIIFKAQNGIDEEFEKKRVLFLLFLMTTLVAVLPYLTYVIKQKK